MTLVSTFFQMFKVIGMYNFALNTKLSQSSQIKKKYLQEGVLKDQKGKTMTQFMESYIPFDPPDVGNAQQMQEESRQIETGEDNENDDSLTR